MLLTPAHQFPTGRRRCTPTGGPRWSTGRARTGGLVLEDDYDGEFRYDRQPVGALQGLDPERVVYLGTASKSLAPGAAAGLDGAAGRGCVDAVLAAKGVWER